MPTIISIQPLHLESKGYGPQGIMTRQQWRAHCLDWLKGDQPNIAHTFDIDARHGDALVDFGVVVTYEDGSVEVVGSTSKRDSITIDFAGQTFTNLSISNRAFNYPTTFAGCIFNGSTSIVRTSVKEGVTFDSAVFQGNADFTGTQFAKNTSFNNAWFAGDLDMREGTTFRGQNNFDNTYIAGSAWFHAARFEGITQFTNFTVAETASFQRTQFQDLADFSQAVFVKRADFAGAAFQSQAIFGNLQCNGEAEFSRISVASRASFVGCRFAKALYLRNATFADEALFSSSKFEGPVDLWNATFRGPCGFQHTAFDDACEFENARFESVGHFESARFVNQTPSFLGVAQETTLIFRGALFPVKASSSASIEHYVALKQISESLGHHEQALRFNALELAARRQQASEFMSSFWFFTLVYGALSDYGQSIVRPLVLYLALICVTWLLAMSAANTNLPSSCEKSYITANLECELDDPDEHVSVSGYRAAFEYSISRALGVLDFVPGTRYATSINKRLFNSAIEPPAMRSWAIAKALLGPLALFLLALGLRNRYRLK